MKKNGVRSTFYAAMERIYANRGTPYVYHTPGEETLMRQRHTKPAKMCIFSILVPAYETKEAHLREMIQSVLAQSYPFFQLIIADASSTDQVERVVGAYKDERIVYKRLKENGGIANNTNEALLEATGDYVGLLDHDDLLTPDALFEMYDAIQWAVQHGEKPRMLYSDEDKGDGECNYFYEPHFKQDFNPELLLSNNYICHFLVMERGLMQSLMFRPAYDGAQDYDLILRAAGTLYFDLCREGRKADTKSAIVHVKKVLYHWRCHSGSTAVNPASKRYAYEAGRRALEDFMKIQGWKGTVEDSMHLGFYHVRYETNVFQVRESVGIVGGKVISTQKTIQSGLLLEGGRIAYYGMPKEFSGYMHQASMQQEAYAVDIRCMKVRKELWPCFEQHFHIPYQEAENGLFDWKSIKIEAECEQLEDDAYIDESLLFCEKVKELGYSILWQPKLCQYLKKERGKWK